MGDIDTSTILTRMDRLFEKQDNNLTKKFDAVHLELKKLNESRIKQDAHITQLSNQVRELKEDVQDQTQKTGTRLRKLEDSNLRTAPAWGIVNRGIAIAATVGFLALGVVAISNKPDIASLLEPLSSTKP